MAISNLSSGFRPGVCTSTTRPSAPYKTCSACKKEQPIEHFSKDKTQPTGLNYQCKSCRSAINKRSYAAQKVVTETHQTCTSCHIEKELNEFYKDSRGQLGRMTRCKPCHNKTVISNHQKNPESHTEASKRWRQNNPDKVRMANSRIKAMRRKAERRTISVADWKSVLLQHRHCCAYCGSAGDLTMDHVVPLVRGGRHSIGNVVPACRSCNSSKNGRFIVEWRKSKWV